MKKRYKSINQKLNESRKHFKSLLNEQYPVDPVDPVEPSTGPTIYPGGIPTPPQSAGVATPNKGIENPAANRCCGPLKKAIDRHESEILSTEDIQGYINQSMSGEGPVDQSLLGAAAAAERLHSEMKRMFQKCCQGRVDGGVTITTPSTPVGPNPGGGNQATPVKGIQAAQDAIIDESIVSEQVNNLPCPTTVARSIYAHRCDGNGTATLPCVTLNGNSPQIGQTFDMNGVDYCVGEVDQPAYSIGANSYAGPVLSMNHTFSQGQLVSNQAYVDAVLSNDPCPNCPVQPQTGSTGCNIGTFADVMNPILATAPQQFVNQLTQNWVPMFFNKYDGHSDGCRFLTKRLSINQNTLATKQAAGTHPQWQAMLTAKIAAIQAIIAECCN